MTDTTAYYACPVQIGRESEVAEELRKIGCAWVWLPMTVKSVITGPHSNRQREWRDVPLWPGYLFAQISDGQYFLALNIRGMHPSKMAIHPHEVSALLRLKAKVDAAHDAAKRRTATESAAEAAFTPGQVVTVLGGVLAERLAAFSRMIHRGGRVWAEISFDGFAVQVDPRDLRAAE